MHDKIYSFKFCCGRIKSAYVCVVFENKVLISRVVKFSIKVVPSQIPALEKNIDQLREYLSPKDTVIQCSANNITYF
jgi:uncharacterized protein involved in tolerance to divalent cations